MAEDLAKALDTLAELITSKSAETAAAAVAVALAKTADGTLPSALGASSAQTEGLQKLELPPNEVKLEGVNNYLAGQGEDCFC